ncbi:hypothetical protein RIEGSTA812A_PEG_1055 [invertebrate metagenome]|uniref:Uncharacterized protein n=1 Tax=invertebrate metagenome TaxID=1711999 RepID=A0A484HCP2_9ZZZZ
MKSFRISMVESLSSGVGQRLTGSGAAIERLATPCRCRQ